MSDTPTQPSVPPSAGPQIDMSLNWRMIGAAAAGMLIVVWLAWFFLWRPFPVDSAIPHYTKVDNLSGNLVSVGSDTLADVMILSAQRFQQLYPGVTVHLEHSGSGTAPSALTDGRSALGPMSRLMTDDEVAAFAMKYGYKPTAYKVALDALAIYVNKSNPIHGLTLQQADDIFSSTLKRGGTSLTSWGSLVLSGGWAHKGIALYGRDRESGTHDYFKEHVLLGGEFKPTVQEEISEQVVDSVANDPSGIGYSGMGWKTSGVRALALGESAEKLLDPTYENSLNGSYPLARFLYVYVNQRPGQSLDPLTGEFIRFLLSHEGQQVVVQAKFFPLPAKIVGDTLNGKN